MVFEGLDVHLARELGRQLEGHGHLRHDRQALAKEIVGSISCLPDLTLIH